MYVCVYICISVYTYAYIYIYRLMAWIQDSENLVDEGERQREIVDVIFWDKHKRNRIQITSCRVCLGKE